MSGFKVDSAAAKDTEEQDQLRALMHKYREVPTPELTAQYRQACQRSVQLHDEIVGMREVLVARQKLADAQRKLDEAKAAAIDALKPNGGPQ